jgi:hypothetical protein
MTQAAVPADRKSFALSVAHPLLRKWLLIVTFAYVALISLPSAPRLYRTGLDPSWMLGLNLAHAQRLVPGRDIIFAYGPLGYLMHPEPAGGASMLALIYRIGLYLLSIAILYRLVTVMPSKLAALWTVLVVGPVIVLDFLPEESQLMLAITLLALLPLVDRSRWRYGELAALSFMAGTGLLVKLNDGIEGIGLFVAVLAAVVLEDWPLTRRARWQAVAAVCLLPLTVVTLFLASTGGLTGLAPSVRYAWEIVSGYAEGTGLPGPLWQAALACAVIAAAIALVWRADDLRSLTPGLAPALIVTYCAFKHAMVRQGPGHTPTFHIYFAVALLFLLVCALERRTRRLIVILQLFSIVTAYGIVVKMHPGFDADIATRLELRHVPPFWQSFAHWPSTWAHLRTAHQANRSKLRLPDRFHRLIGNGSVDAVPWEVDLVEANGWKWLPRPVFQSSSAYTPLLDEAAATHLESGRTADFVLLEFAAIDGHHPFFESPHSWLALLDRYDLILSGPRYLLLQHRSSHRCKPAVFLGSSIAHWDEDLPVPQADGWLLMAPHIQTSLFGSMAAAALRPAPVFVEVTYASGKMVSWRCVPRTLASGFLIHPFPPDLEGLRSLFAPDQSGNSSEPVTSVRFHTDRTGQFSSEISIGWSRLPVEAAALISHPLPPSSLTPLWLPKDRPPLAVQAQIRLAPHWIEVTPVTADPQLWFDLGPGLGRYRTLIVRARFQKADRIDAFFGKQVDGRGLTGSVPLVDQWLDVYVNMSHNPFWEDEHGTVFRFDPVSSAGPGTTADIAGIWGATEAVSPAEPDMEFYSVQEPK